MEMGVVQHEELNQVGLDLEDLQQQKIYELKFEEMARDLIQ